MITGSSICGTRHKGSPQSSSCPQPHQRASICTMPRYARWFETRVCCCAGQTLGRNFRFNVAWPPAFESSAVPNQNFSSHLGYTLHAHDSHLQQQELAYRLTKPGHCNPWQSRQQALCPGSSRVPAMTAPLCMHYSSVRPQTCAGSAGGVQVHHARGGPSLRGGQAEPHPDQAHHGPH